MGRELRTEEDVKVHFLLPFLQAHGYDVASCDFERSIEVHEGRRRKHIFVDVVVYAAGNRSAPLICCETKGPNEILDRLAREQAISYARLLPKIAPLTLLTNGRQTQVFQTLDKSRLDKLPLRSALDDDIVNFLVSTRTRESLQAEAKHELFIVDDVQTFKRLLKSCHDEIRNNEGYDPTQAFDEMSKVLFCKMYEEKRAGSNRFRLAIFDDTLATLGVNIVQKIFDETRSDRRYEGLFEGQSGTIGLQDRTVRKIVGLFEDTDLSLTAFDVKGEAFEYFLGDTFTGGLGQYFTPRNVVQFITDAVDLKIGQKIVDPFCGTGGFLIHAFETLAEKIRLQEFSEAEKERWRLELSNRSLYGSDWAERTSQTCKMNMVVHGDGSAGIVKHHGLVDVPGIIEEGAFDVCLTNPPFGSMENDPEVLRRYDLGNKKRSLDRVVLAIERAVRLVRPGGQIGIVVTDGILGNSRNRYVRDYIRQNCRVRAVIGLSPATFEGYGGRSDTAIMILERKDRPDEGQQYPVFLAIANNTGYAPNGDPIVGNELPDILLDYQAFKRSEPVGSRSNSWTSEVGDRLDPEYYQRVTDTLTQGLESAASQRAELANAISAASALLDSLKERLSATPDFTSYRSLKIGQLLKEVRETERLEGDRRYALLGVRWWGDGAYIREEKYGRDVAAKTLTRVVAGSLVYNRLFAYRGSFAVVGQDLDGAYASNEFPMFVPKPRSGYPSKILLSYLVCVLNAPQNLAMIDAMSTGSTRTSRNRFMQDEFAGLTVLVPSNTAELRQIVESYELVARLKAVTKDMSDLARGFQGSTARLLPPLQR
jgi:type I restriction enzyme M protein